MSLNNDIIFHGNDNFDEMIIHWFPTDFCNYQCSYCISHAPHTKGKIEFTDINTMKNTADKIFSINKKKYTFMFSGGEPTIYPYFKDLVNHISSKIYENKYIYIYLFSNGHKSVNYFEELFQIKNFFLNFSIHLEFFKIEHLKEIIQAANKYDKYIMCSLMLNPNFKDMYKNIYDELLEFRKKYFFGIDLGLIHNNQKLDSRYTKADIEWFDKSKKEIEEIENINKYKGYIPDYYQDRNTRYIFSNNEKIYIEHREAISKDMKCFKDFYCLSGVNSISINAQGNYKGVECSLAPFIGNIYQDEIDYIKLILPIKCSLEGCDCRLNNYSPKYRYKHMADKCMELNIDKTLSKKYLYDKLEEANIKLNELKNEIILLENNNNIKINNLIDAVSNLIPIKKVRKNFIDKVNNIF